MVLSDGSGVYTGVVRCRDTSLGPEVSQINQFGFEVPYRPVTRDVLIGVVCESLEKQVGKGELSNTRP